MSKSAQDLTRKELKGPDSFQSAATQAAGWASGHRKPLVLVLAGAAAVVVVALALLSWQSSRREKAGALLFRALTPTTGQVSDVPLPNAQGPFFKTFDEKQKAIVAEAAGVRERFGSSRAAATASLAEADARFHLGEYDAAMTAYRAYLDDAPKDDSLRYGALDGIARIHETKGALDESAKAWEQAADVKAFADRATIERARVLAKAGKVEEAKKLLQEFPEKFKESTLQSEAQARLAKLGK